MSEQIFHQVDLEKRLNDVETQIKNINDEIINIRSRLSYLEAAKVDISDLRRDVDCTVLSVAHLSAMPEHRIENRGL